MNLIVEGAAVAAVYIEAQPPRAYSTIDWVSGSRGSPGEAQPPPAQRSTGLVEERQSRQSSRGAAAAYCF